VTLHHADHSSFSDEPLLLDADDTNSLMTSRSKYWRENDDRRRAPPADECRGAARVLLAISAVAFVSFVTG
jgi:hypothetical protein